MTAYERDLLRGLAFFLSVVWAVGAFFLYLIETA